MPPTCQRRCLLCTRLIEVDGVFLCDFVLSFTHGLLRYSNNGSYEGWTIIVYITLHIDEGKMPMFSPICFLDVFVLFGAVFEDPIA